MEGDVKRLSEEQMRLMVEGPSSDETKRLAFKQMTSAFHFAYVAWECRALGRTEGEVGSFACYSLRNASEACKILKCDEAAIVDKMQKLSDWLDSKGLVGIRALLKTPDGRIVVEAKLASELVGQMRQFRHSWLSRAEEGDEE